MESNNRLKFYINFVNLHDHKELLFFSITLFRPSIGVCYSMSTTLRKSKHYLTVPCTNIHRNRATQNFYDSLLPLAHREEVVYQQI